VADAEQELAFGVEHLFDIARHGVDAAGEFTQVIIASDLNTVGKFTLAHATYAGLDIANRTQQTPDKYVAGCEAGEDESEHGEKHETSAAFVIVVSILESTRALGRRTVPVLLAKTVVGYFKIHRVFGQTHAKHRAVVEVTKLESAAFWRCESGRKFAVFLFVVVLFKVKLDSVEINRLVHGREVLVGTGYVDIDR